METRRCWWRIGGWAISALVASGVLATSPAWAGEPVVGIDVGAAIPVSNSQRTVDPGGMFAPFVGYRLGKTFAVTAELQPQFATFPTAIKARNDVTSLFALTSGLRFSMIDEGKEVFFKCQGGVYHALSGPLEPDTSGGFAIAGGFNYEFQPGTALGLFIRRDQTGINAAPDTKTNFIYLSTGLSLTHRFLPAPPAPPPAPMVAEAPPPAPPPPMKRKIVLRGVNFDFDKSNIRADAAPVLDEAVSTLKEASTVTVAVEGHTDSRGSDEYNQGLSERRANAVRDYLAGHGISKSRMTTEGFGESRPVATNDTDEGRAQNRRVELRVTAE